MKPSITLLENAARAALAVAGSFGAVPAVRAASAIQPEAFLAALAQVESGTAQHPQGNDAALGKHGERSRYQMTFLVWHSHTSRCFADATWDPPFAHQVALRQVRRILQLLERRDRPCTAQEVARWWNPRAPADYAERIANLCAEEKP